MHQIYLLLLAVSLRWTLIEYKYAAFLRNAIGHLCDRTKYTRLVWAELIKCPFCNGTWAGFVVFLLFEMRWDGVSVQLAEFWLFAIATGYLSLFSEVLLKPLLKELESH